VIGPSTIPSAFYFSEFFNGPTPPGRTASSLAYALEAEAQAWSQRRRDPHKISEAARHQMGSLIVAKKIVPLASEINPFSPRKS
jgi:hypothetical protein